MSSAALFKVLYQDETLFRLQDKEVKTPALPPAAQPAVQESQPVREMPAANVTVKSTPSISIPEKPAFPALEHPIVVLADEPKQAELLVSETLFLDNVLKAVGHSMDAATVLNLSYLPGRDARKALSDKRARYFITFGVPLIKINLDLLLTPYAPKMIEGVWFLLADPLVVIEADRNLKKKLWQALQKMFEVA